MVRQDWPEVCRKVRAFCPEIPACYRGNPDGFLPQALACDPAFARQMTDYEMGRITTRAFIDFTREWFARGFGYTGGYDDMLEAHKAIIGAPIGSSVEIFRKLSRNLKIRLGMVSDNNQAHTMELFNRYGPIMNLVPRAHVVLSQEGGYDKTTPQIFSIALERLRSAGENTVMIDDSPYKLESAAKAGMRTIRYAEGVDIGTELAKLGVEMG